MSRYQLLTSGTAAFILRRHEGDGNLAGPVVGVRWIPSRSVRRDCAGDPMAVTPPDPRQSDI